MNENRRQQRYQDIMPLTNFTYPYHINEEDAEAKNKPIFYIFYLIL